MTACGIPSCSTETLDAYMHLPKPQQDALKDVGGFVGGSLNSGRRKANAVTGRDLVTLDFDNIPGWGTDEIISRVDAIGCSYAVYSTRKHCPNKPRLRVVIPLDHTAAPDEYEPLARRLAWLIGIDKARPYHLSGKPHHVLAERLRGFGLCVPLQGCAAGIRGLPAGHLRRLAQHG